MNLKTWTPAAGCLLFLFLSAPQGRGAIGCTLSNPAQDLKYLFPEMTTYREEVRDLDKLPDGCKVYDGLKDRIGAVLDPLYEAFETPYTVYTVFKDGQVVGIVHGVNVPGEGGVIQIFVSATPEKGAIRRLFFQRLESVAARWLKQRTFLDQFKGLTLADFYKHDYFKAADSVPEQDRVGRIQSPLPDEKGRADYEAAMRGVRKNLVLLDVFVYQRQNEVFFQKAQEALAGLKK
jgi:hypothetical protein